MSTPSLGDLLACCVAAVHAAGRHALAEQHRRNEVAQRDLHDVKLVLDSESQAKAEAVIRSAYPHHAILGEEGRRTGEDGGPVWVIDPIDGTVNFSHGLPYWCSSVAVQIGGRSVAGAVFAPVAGDLYTATTEESSRRNGQPIRVSTTDQLSDVLALTGLEKSLDQHVGTLDVVRSVTEHVQKIRLLGAAALDLCVLASGQADAFFESGIHVWDVAAAGLIVERAGGRVEVLKHLDDTRFRYLASNGRVHAAFRDLIVKWYASQGAA